MTTWALLAPGPSASAELAARVRGVPLGAIGCAYQLAPQAVFVASSDAAWWRAYPEAKGLPVSKFCMGTMNGIEKVWMPEIASVVNSGVLGLECARRAGATRILLLGFDMRGTHYFGPYTNGLTNTNDVKRRVHLQQYARWKKAHRDVEVINCTPGSALLCFPQARLDDVEDLLGEKPEPERTGTAGLHLAAA